MRDRIVRRDLAFAFQTPRREFVEPRERDPEREADDRRNDKPSHRPFGRGEKRPELRDALRQRPYRAGVQHARAQDVAAFEFMQEGRLDAHCEPAPLGAEGKPILFNAAWKRGSLRTGSNTGCHGLSSPNTISCPICCMALSASS